MPFGSLPENQRLAILLELIGGPKFVAEMNASAAATARLEAATRAQARASALATRRTWLQQQAIFTLRRYAFYGTLAITALAGAVVKLGYSYLSAMQQARVALSPVIKDQRILQGYLDDLFRISKYSPFVISDLTKSFSALFVALNPKGVQAPQIINTLQSIVNYLSVVQQTTPLAMRRITNALTDLAYQGTITGRMYQRLGQIGIPIGDILTKTFNLTAQQLKDIGKLGIPAVDVLKAINQYARTNPLIRGAAARLSLGTFSGLMATLKDTLSQISGAFIKSSYGDNKSGVQGFLYNLLKPHGPLDKLSTVATNKGGAAGVLFLSKQLTGNTGLGKGLLLILETLRNIGTVFAKVVIPAFVIGLHSLIVFYPVLKLLNFALVQITKHATLFKVALSILASYFVVTHGAALGAWIGLKLFKIATFGSIGPLVKLIAKLKLLRTVELAGMIKRLRDYAFATRYSTYRNGTWGNVLYKNNSIAAKTIRFMRTLAVATWGVAAATWSWTLALLANPITWIVAGVIALIGILVLLYFKWKWFHNAVNTTFQFIKQTWPVVKYALEQMFMPIIIAAKALGYIVRHADAIGHGAKRVSSSVHRSTNFGTLIPRFGHATGGYTSSSPALVGERGPELAFLPIGSRIVPNQSVKSTLDALPVGSSNEDRPLYATLIMPNGDVLADIVARARGSARGRRG